MTLGRASTELCLQSEEGPNGDTHSFLSILNETGQDEHRNTEVFLMSTFGHRLSLL